MGFLNDIGKAWMSLFEPLWKTKKYTYSKSTTFKYGENDEMDKVMDEMSKSHKKMMAELDEVMERFKKTTKPFPVCQFCKEEIDYKNKVDCDNMNFCSGKCYQLYKFRKGKNEQP